MWKYLAAVVLLIGLTIYVSMKDEGSAQQGTPPSAHSDKNAAVAKDYGDQGKGNIAYTQWNPPRWHGFFRWPDGTTVWAIILTLFVIAEQTVETRKAAEAALLSAQSVIDAERPWVTAKAENFQAKGKLIPIATRFMNEGRTPAKIKSARATWRFVPFPSGSWGRPGILPSITRVRSNADHGNRREGLHYPAEWGISDIRDYLPRGI